MMSMSLSNIPILTIKGSDYCCIVSLISKNQAINLMENGRLTKKTQNIIKHKKLLSHIKLGKEILMFRILKLKKINSTTIRLLFCWEQ